MEYLFLTEKNFSQFFCFKRRILESHVESISIELLINDEEVRKTDPYRNKMFKADPYYAKTILVGNLAVILDGQYPERGLTLIPQPSRAICRYDVHELIVTDDDAKPGDIVNPIAYLGFVEFERGGVMVVGDRVEVNGEDIGYICGFDETHMPNHLNIVVRGQRNSGRERGFELEQQVKFIKKTGQ